jgi:hypothetical protein
MIARTHHVVAEAGERAWTARVLTRRVLHGTFLCHELNMSVLHGNVVIWHIDAPGAYRDTVYSCPGL